MSKKDKTVSNALNRHTTPKLASLYQAVDLRQQIAPLIIGERCNPTGSKRFRELLLAEDLEGCLEIALEQERKGAHLIDLNVAWAGRDERTDMVHLVQLFGRSLRAPLMIDSTNPEIIEAALKNCPGRPVVNSINLEDGDSAPGVICNLVRKYGACVTALTIDEQGMAMDCDRKFEVARRMYDLAVNEHGLAPEDLLFDPLTFTIASGDEKLKTAALETLAAIRRIKTELPGCHTVLGLSNISFGLPPAARRILNAVFLHEAVAAGLDAVIIDPDNCIPLDRINPVQRELAMGLIHNRGGGNDGPLMAFINHFSTHIEEESKEEERTPPEQILQERVRQGSKQDLPDLIEMLLESYAPLAIINQILVPAMRKVGELFGDGEMLLPFVLQSAEVMRASVDLLEPHMDKKQLSDAPTVLLATVQGDVHDIGKNLVNIILSNNGCRVIDLGIKVPIETIIQSVREHPEIDVICLSGLLVKSAMIMQESMPLLKSAGLKLPVLLGGAALTRRFVAEDCAPAYDGPVVYCKDAFTGLAAIREHEAGTLRSTTWDRNAPESTHSKTTTEVVATLEEIPSAPFLGARTLAVNPEDFLPLIHNQTLFRGRWGYKQGRMSNKQYQELLQQTVLPELEQVQETCRTQQLIQAQIRSGWFPCVREDQALLVDYEGTQWRFPLPRQNGRSRLSLVDYFRTREQGGDILGLFLVTVGPEFARSCHELYKANKYHEYLLLHGYGVEAAEALAQYAHRLMRKEIGIEEQGQRYSFGYSACPDLELQKPLISLLQGDKIGIQLSDNLEMIPEQSVSALVVHHPQARYFAV
ncbi:MAG: dihydropteroate synthase [Desulfobulbaceae bacterium]|uniref:methionine synthase n=1 Tax=Candidatus Desulfatifera sulfidica TaxID=2841691 RepID=A0A8J6N7X4_9BACT|nr:dihydropteroate synthase [Candidatus Desulfatifera sulfidica]